MEKVWYKSFSAWMTLLGIAGTVVVAIAGYIPADLMIKVTAFLIAVIVGLRQLKDLARIIVKMTATPKDDEALAKFEIVLAKIEEVAKQIGVPVPAVK